MSPKDLLRSGAARLVSLMTVACLSGVTDSVMSPYLCPLVRDRTGAGNTMCGIIISARSLSFIYMKSKCFNTCSKASSGQIS